MHVHGPRRRDPQLLYIVRPLKKMRKRIATSLTFMMVVALGCRVGPNASVSAALKSAVSASANGSEIRLSSMTDFKWSFVVAFGPYTSRQAAEDGLGFAWPEFDKFGLEQSDAFSLLVFVSDNKVVRVEQLRRCHPDLSPKVLGRRLSPDSAVFILRKGGGCDVLDPRSAV